MSVAADPLDPQLRVFVDALMQEGARLRAGRSLDWPQRRQLAEQVRARWNAGGPAMAQVLDRRLPTAHGPLPVRVLRPSTAPALAPVVLYAHGGGWCMFNLRTHDRLLREYAHAAGAVVVAPDYALAPEHPFPAALEQCLATVAWLRTQAAQLQLDPARLALAGDSAGANLALATALALRAGAALDGVRALLLNYGAFDPVISPQAAPLGTSADLLSVAEMDEFWRCYLGPEAARCRDPLAVPVYADLHGLPPSLLVYGQCDVLGEQSQAMATRLRQAGNVALARSYPGAPHSFVEALSVSTQARAAVDAGADWLAGHLSPLYQEARSR